MNYLEFLEKKKHLIGDFGFNPTFFPDIAFDFQKYIIEKAIKKGRMFMYSINFEPLKKLNASTFHEARKKVEKIIYENLHKSK